MAQVVAIHGIFHQYGSRPSMCQDWVPHLLGGVDNATGRRDLLTEADVACCFYGGVFRTPGQRLSFGVPAYAADDITDPLEQELLLRWWEAAAAVDPAVVPPDAQTLSTRSLIQRALLALASFRPFAMYAERHLIFFLKQVTAYLTNAETRATIQQCFADVFGSDANDIVALVKKLGACFDGDIADYEIDNGLRVHGVEHYLAARDTGIAIVAGLTLDA